MKIPCDDVNFIRNLARTTIDANWNSNKNLRKYISCIMMCDIKSNCDCSFFIEVF